MELTGVLNRIRKDNGHVNAADLGSLATLLTDRCDRNEGLCPIKMTPTK
jgi:hypothetical protein